MEQISAFGTAGQIDAYSDCYGTTAEGNFHFALSEGQGKTDALSFELSEPLQAGTSYRIRFWGNPPPGYITQRHRRLGLITVGASIFGVAYAGSLFVSAAHAPLVAPLYAIPVVGPNLVLSKLVREGYRPMTLLGG